MLPHHLSRWTVALLSLDPWRWLLLFSQHYFSGWFFPWCYRNHDAGCCLFSTPSKYLVCPITVTAYLTLAAASFSTRYPGGWSVPLLSLDPWCWLLSLSHHHLCHWCVSLISVDTWCWLLLLSPHYLSVWPVSLMSQDRLCSLLLFFPQYHWKQCLLLLFPSHYLSRWSVSSL